MAQQTLCQFAFTQFPILIEINLMTSHLKGVLYEEACYAKVFLHFSIWRNDLE